MAIDFPSNPANNQTYSYSGQSWYWANNYGVWQASTGPIFTTSASAPSNPKNGDLWWNTELGMLLIYYNDGDSSQWVSAIPNPASPKASNFSYSIIFGGI
jgi:hypothetical protein